MLLLPGKERINRIQDPLLSHAAIELSWSLFMPKFYSKNSNQMVTRVEDKYKFSTEELAAYLKRKRIISNSVTCDCGSKKTPGFMVCYHCFKRGKHLEKSSSGAKNQEAQKKKYGPNRKNRKKSKIIDLILSRNASLPLSRLSKPNDPQYCIAVKTILRSKSKNQLQQLADELKPLTPLEQLEDF